MPSPTLLRVPVPCKTPTLHEDVCAFSAKIARGMHANGVVGNFLSTQCTQFSRTDVAALRRLGPVNSLRISGDLPELHPDLQINHEAGKALLCSWQPSALGPVSGLLQHSITANHREAQLE